MREHGTRQFTHLGTHRGLPVRHKFVPGRRGHAQLQRKISDGFSRNTEIALILVVLYG